MFICPLCRKETPFNSILTLNELKKNSNNNESINSRYVVQNKCDEMPMVILILLLIIMIILFLFVHFAEKRPYILTW